MVNCNDTIRVPSVNATDCAVSADEQVKRPIIWHAAIIGIVVSAVEYLARLQARSRDRHALRRLDGDTLKDLGLTRLDIEQDSSKSLLSGFPWRG